jgi:translation initiation factor IF-2
MADTKDTEKTLRPSSPKTLTVKRNVEQGVVRQSFSHGRSKSVVVETVKRRTIAPAGKKAEAPEVKRAAPAAAPKAAPKAAAPAPKPAAIPDSHIPPKPSGVVLRTLTEEERDARGKALDRARVREAEERKSAEEEAHRRSARDAIDRADREAAEARKREEEARRASEEEKKRKAEQEARKRFGDVSGGVAGRTTVIEDDDEGPRTSRRGGKTATAPRPTRGTAEAKSRGRLTVVTAFSDNEERQRSIAAFRRRTQRISGHRPSDEPKEKISREVVIPEIISIQELANRMAERAVDVIRLLMKQGQMATINDTIDADTAQLIAEELGHTVKRVAEADVVEVALGRDPPDQRRRG